MKQIYKEGHRNLSLSLISETLSAAFMDDGHGHSIFKPKWPSPYFPHISYIGAHTVCLSQKHVEYLWAQKKSNKDVQKLYRHLSQCFAPEETFIPTVLMGDLEREIEKKDVFGCFSVTEEMTPDEFDLIWDEQKFQAKSNRQAEEVCKVFQTYGHRISIRPVRFKHACFIRKISNPVLIDKITAHFGGSKNDKP